MGNSKEVNKRYYEANKQKIVAINKAAKKRNFNFVTKLKSEGVCADCGQNPHPIAMQYDHINDDKVSCVSKMVVNGFGLETIKAEIAKCELVCANCHAIRTWNRAHPASVA